MTTRHLVIACGGTGGHFFPTLSIAQAYQATGNPVTLMISGVHAQEQMKLAEANGIPAVMTNAERLSSKNPLKVLAFGFRFLKNALQARQQLKELKADLLLGMGSYAALPACLFKPANIPLFLHEGNAFMGKSNRVLASKATAIGLSLPLAHKEQLKNKPADIVGMPLRQAVLDGAAAPRSSEDDAYLLSLGLQPNVKTLLVFGGSLGAQFINQTLAQAAPLLKELHLQIIHLTGTDDNSALIDAYKQAGLAASVRRAESHIEKCYRVANLTLCRGGASTLCELALFGMPAIIIPLPSAADDHQSCNANLAQQIGGAQHLPQKQASPEKIAALVRELIFNPEQLTNMGSNIRKLAVPDAAQRMVNLLLKDY